MAYPLPRPAFDAIVLAGGRGSRLGGTDKPGLVVGASTIVSSVVRAAIGAGAQHVVVVGPPRPELLTISPWPPGGLAVVREDPPAAGPVPAVRRGLAGTHSPWVAVLAADMPFLSARHLRALLTAASRAETRGGPAPPGGAVLVDDTGYPQWLAGCWQAAALQSAAQAYGGSSLRGLLLPLQPALVSTVVAAGEPPPWLDCDTAGDLERAREFRGADTADEGPH